jgi:hypothetical protein
MGLLRRESLPEFPYPFELRALRLSLVDHEEPVHCKDDCDHNERPVRTVHMTPDYFTSR